MFTRWACAATIGLGVMGFQGALAQGAAETGTGGDAGSTMSAPNTSAVGKTKPPGRAAAPGESEDGEARTVEKKKADDVMKGICVGCGVK